MNKNKNPDDKIVEISEEELINLSKELEQAKDKEQRSLADYQNLVRRTKEEKFKIIKFATKDFVESLIQPLDHLSLAAGQINDAGLNMIVVQLWKVFKDNGLEKIDCMGKEFNVDIMEVIEKGEKGKKVVKVVKDGYFLNDEVVQHAKVILD